MVFPLMATRRLAPDAAGIATCAAILRSGGIVGLPTETVYGLAGDATDPTAVARIYAAKGRPSFNPLIAHLPDITAARRQGLFDANALALARAFWPGPLTLVVPASASTMVCDLARAGLDSVALRVPASPLARAVLEAVARPVAAPSANRSGRISPTSAQHVIDELDGLIDAVLDGGPATVGVESTIVACLSGAPRLLRPGGITQAQIEAVTGREIVTRSETSGIIAPGMLASHYAPQAKLRLEAISAAADEAFLAFGPVPAAANAALQILSLSPSGDLIEAASNLFGHLRLLDATGVRSIAVAPVPAAGIGEAINDRLARAASPR
jgi:L-threonylcarbamoyladenylate synthase